MSKDMTQVQAPVHAKELTPEQRTIVQLVGHNWREGPIVLARAKGAWSSQEASKLTLSLGGIVKVTDKFVGKPASKNGWWEGTTVSNEISDNGRALQSKPALFPFAYVEEIKGLGCERCRLGLDPLLSDSFGMLSDNFGMLQRNPWVEHALGGPAQQIIREGHLLKHPFKQDMSPDNVVELVKLTLKGAIDALAPPKRRLFRLVDGGYTHGYSLEWFDDADSASPTKKGHIRLIGHPDGWGVASKCRITRGGDALTVEVPVIGNTSAQPYQLVMKGEPQELDGWAQSLKDAIQVADERLNSLASLRKL